MDKTHSVPVNRTAALVVSRGESYTPEFKQSDIMESPLPLPVQDFPSTSQKDHNLTGISFAWLTVIGLSAEKSGRWVCRCVCGMYCIRSPKAIKNKSNDKDACRECRHRIYVSRRESDKADGKYKPNKIVEI